MATCTEISAFKKTANKLYNELTAANQKLVVGSAELAKNRASLDALTVYLAEGGDKESLAAIGKYQQGIENKTITATSLALQVLGTSFDVTFKDADKPVSAVLDQAVPTAKGLDLFFVVGDELKLFSFPKNTRGKSSTRKGGGPVYIKDARKLLDAYYLDESISIEIPALGSQDTALKMDREYKVSDYSHGSIKDMQGMLNKLHVAGGSKAKKEDLDAYMELLSEMSPKFFSDLDLYVKDQADITEGVARADRIDLTVSRAPKEFVTQQSEASVYMEEVVHSMTAAALTSTSQRAVRLKRTLAKSIEKARKQVTYKHFLPENPSVKDVDYAKWLYNYVFNTETADYEFIAKALTVPELTKALKKVKVKEEGAPNTLLGVVYSYFGKIMDYLKGDADRIVKGDNVHSVMVSLSYRLGEINRKSSQELSGNNNPKVNLFVRLIDIVNNIDGTTAAYMERLKGKLTSRTEGDHDPKMPDDLLGRVKWLSSFLYLAMVNPTYTKVVGSFVSAMGLPPESTLREIVSGFFEKDSLARAAEGLAMVSSYIDKKRNKEVDIIKDQVLSLFADVPEKATEEALTAVFMDSDLAHLVGRESVTDGVSGRLFTYSKTTIEKLLKDDAYLDQRIRFVKSALKEADKANFQWNSTQSYLLGTFMATGKATTETNFNAENIAKGYLSSSTRDADPVVVKAVDELATLEALKQTAKTEKEIAAQLVSKDWPAVDRVTEIMAGFSKNSDTVSFSEGSVHKVKGYSRQIYDDSVVVEVAPLSDRTDMEKQGFTLKSVLTPVGGESRSLQMGLYVTSSAGRVDRLRGATRFNSIKSKGTTIKDINYKEGELFSSSTIRMRAKRDIARIGRMADRRAKLMETGKHTLDKSVWGLAPVLNDKGEVVDYRYMMSKADRKSMLKQDTRVSEVLSRSFGTLVDKDLSTQHNKKVLDLLLDDMDKNWVRGTRGKDGLTPYLELGPESSDKDMRKLYYMLPRSFREEAKNRGYASLAVRRDVVHTMFGYSNLTLMDFPGLKRITPKVVKRAMAIGEAIWVDAVKLVKGNILLKTPAVITSNILSNVLYATMRGYNPIRVLSMYADSYKDIKLYDKSVKEVQEIDNKLLFLSQEKSKKTTTQKRISDITNEFEVLTQKRKALTRRNEDSPIHELILLGLDQNAEDSANDVGDSSNSIVKVLEDQVGKTPEFVQYATDVVFITRRTTFYKLANEFLETSDLIARDVQNRLEKEEEIKQANGLTALPLWWLEQNSDTNYKVKQKLKGGERARFLEGAEKQRKIDLVEDYVNYSKPSGRFEEYLNRVGILMFTKYVKRIQKIILKNSTSAPLKSLAAMLGFSYTLDLPTIHEQSFLAKDWYTDSIGPGNVFPVYGPIDIMGNLLTPPALKFVPY